MNVIIHSVTGTFTTEAGFFDTTERGFSCRNEAFIDAHHTGFKTLRHSPHLSVIVAVEIVSQSSSSAVSDGYSFIFRVKSVNIKKKLGVWFEMMERLKFKWFYL